MENPWTGWSTRNGITLPSDKGEISSNDASAESDSMLLQRSDAELFGLCPAWEEFYLVVCEECNNVFKPMALKHHIELRHSGSSRSPSTASSEISAEPSTPKSSSSIKLQTKKYTSASITGPVKLKLTKAASKELPRLERETAVSNSQENSKDDNSSSSNSSSVTFDKIQPATTWKSEESPVCMSVVMLTKPLGGSNGGASGKPNAVAEILKRPLAVDSLQPKKKFLPCKDREYDPNKHCGVVTPESEKPCTRSLTCKTHSLSLRRGVPGRVKSFDDLLSDHRAAKEQKPPSLTPTLQLPPQLLNPPSPLAPSPPTVNAHQPSPARTTPSPKIQPPSLQHVVLATADGSLTLPVMRIGTVTPPPPPQLVRHDPGPLAPVLSAAPRTIVQENPAHQAVPVIQPKPAAMCTFGVRVLSSTSVLMLDRKWDTSRTTLNSMMCPQTVAAPVQTSSGNRQISSAGAIAQKRKVATPCPQLAKKLLSSVRTSIGSAIGLVGPPGQLPPAQLTSGDPLSSPTRPETPITTGVACGLGLSSGSNANVSTTRSIQVVKP